MGALEAILTGESAPEPLLLLMLPLGAVSLLLLAFFAGDGQRERLTKRISKIKINHLVSRGSEAERVAVARRKTTFSDIAALDSLLKRLLPRQEMLRLRIERAGLGISLGVYVLTSLLLAVITLLLVLKFSDWPAPAAIFLGIAGGISLPHFFLGFRITRRRNKFTDLFPDAIDLMVRGIKAGLPITESIKNAGDEIADPVGTELKRVTDGLRIGRQLDELLWESSERLEMQEFDFFTIALSIQAETGGNLAETLANLSDVLRGRRQLKRKIRALSSEAKASAYIIGSLPFIMTLLIYLTNSAYIISLFVDPRGQAMIGFGLFMIAAGVGVMFRMVKFKI